MILMVALSVLLFANPPSESHSNIEAQIRALLARPDRTELLKTLRLPTLVLCGNDDSWSPLSRHEEMARLINHQLGGATMPCGPKS